MKPRTLFTWIALQLTATALACAVLRAWLALDERAALVGQRVVTLWQHGSVIERAVQDHAPSEPPSCLPECTRVVERVVAAGRMIAASPAWIAWSIVSGRDGIAATLGQRTAYLTPTELLARQAGSHGLRGHGLELHVGLDDPDAVLDELATQLGTQRAELLSRARFSRIVVAREDDAGSWPDPRATLTPENLRASIASAMRYLVRHQQSDGAFDYQLDPLHDSLEPGESLPRHGGATLALAEWAAYSGDAASKKAAVRAARYLQRRTSSCGEWRCVGDGSRVDAGSSALAVMAYVALATAGVPDTFGREIDQLSAFLRSLQRPDGEFMHEFDRDGGHAIDIQRPYYSGEVVLALARAARLTGDESSRRAASRGLVRLARRSLVQNRYVFQTEHWLCQAVEELPDPDVLSFCLDHQAYNRLLQDSGGVVPSFRGGFFAHSFAVPRIAPTGSRTEGAMGTLVAARRAGIDRAELAKLERQVQDAVGFLLRHQLQPGPHYSFPAPRAAEGGFPGSPTELLIRIDYQQHAAGAMLRYLRMIEGSGSTPNGTSKPTASH